MFRIRFNIVIYRYEIIATSVLLLLMGSIAISSRDADRINAFNKKYPFKIALTFDDGPHLKYTDRLLNILKNEDVRATFFVVGKKIEQNPHLIKHIAESGHELAGHSFTHRNLSKLSDSEIIDEMVSTNSLIYDISKQNVKFFRPPGGQYNANVIKIANRLGLIMVLWTIFPKDHQENDPDLILNRILSQANNGGVVLLHSGREATLEALPRIVNLLRKRGYDFVTISELYKSSTPEQLAKYLCNSNELGL